jgi:2'-5' RNA ligase
MSERLFIAVDIDSEGVKNRLESVQEELQPYGRNSLTSPEQFHITMNFIGEVSEEEREEIHRRLAKITQSKREISLGGLGAFPDKDYIKVIWAGVHRGREQTHQLSETIREQLDERHRDDHDVHPHVTLMRLKDINREEKQQLQETLEDHADTEFGHISIDSFLLKKAHANPPGQNTPSSTGMT